MLECSVPEPELLLRLTMSAPSFNPFMPDLPGNSTAAT
jgi:hypothetical protein